MEYLTTIRLHDESDKRIVMKGCVKQFTSNCHDISFTQASIDHSQYQSRVLLGFSVVFIIGFVIGFGMFTRAYDVAKKIT
jgi:hypothetical protein